MGRVGEAGFKNLKKKEIKKTTGLKYKTELIEGTKERAELNQVKIQ